MIASKKSQTGITLLEVMLVMVIGGAILYFSIQQYLTFRNSANVQQVNSNVDTIFQAMGLFYRANCRGGYDYKQNSYTGYISGYNQFYVAVTQAPLNPYPQGVYNQYYPVPVLELVVNGFLNPKLPVNPIVYNNPKTGWTSGYLAQFNGSVSDRVVCTKTIKTSQPATISTPFDNCSQTKQIGYVYQYSMLVAVELNTTNPTEQKDLLNELGGNCLSTTTTQGANVIVSPCSSGIPGKYVVWERNPSSNTSGPTSPMWLSMPSNTQFTQMYNTHEVEYLTDSNGKLPNGWEQTFLCGS